MKILPSILLLFLVLISNNGLCQTYQLTDLGVWVGTNSYAQGVNNQSQVVGYWDASGGAHAFLYQSGAVTDLGLLGLSGTNNYALSINNLGQVVGFSEISNGSSAFLYQNGAATNIGNWSGLNSYAYGISDNGYIAGRIETLEGARAALFSNGGITNLGTLGGTNSMAFGVNSALQVVGTSLTADNATTHAFLWQNGSMVDLNQLLPYGLGWNLVEARAVNEEGDIVGWGGINNQEHAFLYHNGGFADLGVLAGGTNSYALGLNNSIGVVGTASAVSGTHAFLWQNGYINDLNDLIGPGSGWELREAWGINDEGQIVGWGIFDGQAHAFLLTPIAATTNGPVITTQKSRLIISGPNLMRPLLAPGAPPTISITNPVNNASFTTPTNLVIMATASDSDGSSPQVQFFAWGQPLGTITNPPYTLTWSNTPVGTFALTAVATDDYGLTATSSVVNITVGTNLAAIADSFVRDGIYTNVNYGTNILLDVQSSSTTGTNRDAYFTFSLGNLTNNISSIKLSVFAVLSTNNAVTNTVYSVTNTSWGEYTITWSNKPARVTALATNTVSGTNGSWYLFDVTSYVKSRLTNGQTVVSLALHDPINTAWLMDVNSRENTTNDPALIVITTNIPPSVSITNPANNMVATEPANILIGATATDNGGISQVQFFQGTTSLGIVTTSPYSLVWSNVAAGSYVLTAVAIDNYGLVSTSSVVNVKIVSLFASNNVCLWLKADAITGLTNNAPIATWLDSSGWSNNATQSTLTNQPLYITNILNSLPVVQFNGTNYFNLPDFLAAATGAEAFVVLKAAVAQPTNTQSLWFMSDAYNTSEVYPGGDGSIQENFGSTSTRSLGVPAQPLTQYHVYEVSAQTNNWAAWVNGVLLYQTFNNVVQFCPASDATYLGAFGYSFYGFHPEYFFNGDLAEVLVFNRPLVPSERTTVNTYLNGKYGLAPAVPPAPTNLVATAISPTQISLTWDEPLTNGGATQISIERSTTSNGPFTAVAQVANTLSYVDTNLMSGTTYYYQVQAINLTQWSPTSNVAQATTPLAGANVPFGNLLLWLKADAGLAQGNTNTPVSFWADQSGNANNATQPVGTNRPVWLPGMIGDRPIVRFNWTNGQYLNLPNFMSATTQAEAFVVLKVAVAQPTNTQSLWFMSDAYNTWEVYPGGDGSIQEDFGSTSTRNLGVPAQPLTQYHVYEVSAQTNDWAAWINGVLLYQTFNNAVEFCGPNDATTLGSSGYFNYGFHPQYFFGGDIAEVLVFNRALTTDERTTVNGYLNGKYGVIATVPPPTNLVANAISQTQIGLTWNEVLADGGGATQISIERKTGSGGTYAVVAQVANALSYVDTNLTAGTTYYYRVRAINMDVWSPYSNETNATTLSNGPDLPLGSLLLWLKADAGIAHATTNTTVGLWMDQSGNGNHAQQGTGSEQPAWVPQALGGLPVVHFNASSNDFLSLPNCLTNLTQAEAFAVVRATLGKAHQSLWFLGNSGNAYDQEYPLGADGTIRENFGSGSSYDLGVPTQPLNQYHVYEVSAQTNNWAAWINGILLYQTNNNTVAFNNSPILSGNFNYPGDTTFFNGDMAEVLIFNRALTGDEKAVVGTYLVSKYGLSQFATNNSTPSAPTNLITIGLYPNQLNLQWTKTSTNETAFSVERQLGTNGTFQILGSVMSGVTNFLDTTAIPTNTNFYRVEALNYFGNSGYSAVISPPTVNLTNIPATLFENTTNLLGAQAADADGNVSSVQLFANIVPAINVPIGIVFSAPFTINWMPPFQTTYSLAALATDNQGNSQFSSAITVTVYLDSNGDGIPDIFQVQSGNDPLNPWVPPSGDTNSAPPNINLVIPANATLLP